MDDSKPYFHSLSEADIKKLEEQKTTWGDVVKNYKQPDWCDYPDALTGPMGCWSLTMGVQFVCLDYCKSCPLFKKHYNYE